MNRLPTTPIRKRLLDDARLLPVSSDSELNVTKGATIAYSSEDREHPVDNLFDGRDGPGGTFWSSARANEAETLLIEFDQRQSISRLIFEVEEQQIERTQEVRIEVSSDGGVSFRSLIIQEYTFSPKGSVFQREDLRLRALEVSHLRLTIRPNKNGSGRATLTSLRLFA